MAIWVESIPQQSASHSAFRRIWLSFLFWHFYTHHFRNLIHFMLALEKIFFSWNEAPGMWGFIRCVHVKLMAWAICTHHWWRAGELNNFLDTIYGKEIPSANLRPLKCNVWYNLSLRHSLPVQSRGSAHWEEYFPSLSIQATRMFFQLIWKKRLANCSSIWWGCNNLWEGSFLIFVLSLFFIPSKVGSNKLMWIRNGSLGNYNEEDLLQGVNGKIEVSFSSCWGLRVWSPSSSRGTWTGMASSLDIL